MYKYSSLYPGSTKYVCGCFQFLCLLGSHIPSLRVDLVCAAFLCVQTMVWLPTLGFLLWCSVIVHGGWSSQWRRVSTGSGLGGKALATARDQTLVHSALDAVPTEYITAPGKNVRQELNFEMYNRSLSLELVIGVWNGCASLQPGFNFVLPVYI